MERRDDERPEGEDQDPGAEPDGGAYIGNRPEFAAETIPGGVRDDDERVAAHQSQSSGEGAADERAQGRTDEWPHGPRETDVPDDHGED